MINHQGLYSGDYLREWLAPILNNDLGIRTFGDLKLDPADDLDMSLPDGHNYRLVVHTSDITRGQLVRLPWDYKFYGHDPDNQDVVDAVRASMSIPFFFKPVQFDAVTASVNVERPNGSVEQTYGGGTVTWVDGGMLRNFPISAFDRVDNVEPRWPTIGVKLSSLKSDYDPTQACDNTISEGVRCLHTMMGEWDGYNLDETYAARTIFVDTMQIPATKFDLTKEEQSDLFIKGVVAATQFVIEMGAAGHIPRTATESRKRLLNLQ